MLLLLLGFHTSHESKNHQKPISSTFSQKKKSIYFFSEKKKMLRICCDPLHKQNKKLAVATNIFHGISESSVKVMYLYFYRFSRSVLSVNEIGQRLLNTA